MIPRSIANSIEQALKRQAAVAIIGPRQVGKTTLARAIADSHFGALYLDLEAREDREKLIEPGMGDAWPSTLLRRIQARLFGNALKKLYPVSAWTSLTDVTKLCNGCVIARNNPADTYFASFSLPDVVEGPGTHFLTLYGSNYLFWDVSNGPSVAWIDGSSAQSLYDDGMTHSNSFQILGDGPAPSATPEPASTALFLSGLALVAGLARRKTRA